MSRPIPADGTSRYSTGSPGREKAPAVAEPPTTPIRAGNTAATIAAIVSRRAQAPRIFPTNVMLLPIPSVVSRTAEPAACPCSQPHLGMIPLFSGYRPWSRPSAVEGRDQVWFQRRQLLAPVRPSVMTRSGKHEGGIVAASLGVGVLEVLVALEGHRLQAVGSERLVRVGAVVKRRGTAWGTVDP